MTPAEVSVIIPSLNEAANIGRAVGSAKSAGAGEVIVSDGGSDDETVAIAEQYEARVIRSPAGRGRQLREGAAAAAGRLLLFLHADNWLAENALLALCRHCDNRGDDGQCLWGGLRQQIESPRRVYRILEWGNAARIRFRGMPFGDQALFVTRSLYQQVGGFRELPLMEDVDLARRLRRVRWPDVLAADVYVDARRWERRGVVRQTIRNWGIQTAHLLGADEQHLFKWYR